MNVETVAKELTVTEAMLAWDEAESYLRESVAEDLQRTDHESFLRTRKAEIFAGITSLWQIRDQADKTIGYAITTMYTPDGLIKVAQIYMASTKDMKLFVSNMDQFEVWAIEREVSMLEIVGRKGWERVLKPFGFRHEYTALTKRLARELH